MRRLLTLIVPLTVLAAACGSSGSGSKTASNTPGGATSNSSVQIAPVDAAILGATDTALLQVVGAANDLRTTLGETGWVTFETAYREFLAGFSGAAASTGKASGPSRSAHPGGANVEAEGVFRQLSDNATQFVESYKTGENSSSSQDFNKEVPFSLDGGPNPRDKVALSGKVSFEALNGRAKAVVEVTTVVTIATTTGTPLVFTVRVSGDVSVTLCPDADGTVIADGNLTVSAEAKGITTGGIKLAAAAVVLEAGIRTTGTVGNDAALTTIDWRNSVTGGVRYDGADVGSISFEDSGAIALSDGGKLSGSTNTSTGTQTDSAIIGTFFPQVKDEVQKIQDGIASKVADFMANDAQQKWRGGYCVEVRATEESRSVDEGEQVGFTATVWSKAEGRDLDTPITATFSGDASLEPSNGKQEPPVAYTYTAGNATGATGTIELKSVSNRGIGTLTLAFTVGKQVKGWQVIVTLPDNPVAGQTVCDLTKPFTLQASQGPVAVVPSSESAGTMSWGYSKDFLRVAGSATYSITWKPDGTGEGTVSAQVRLETDDISTLESSQAQIFIAPLDQAITGSTTTCP